MIYSIGIKPALIPDSIQARSSAKSEALGQGDPQWEQPLKEQCGLPARVC